jgi:hypothetical protein
MREGVRPRQSAAEGGVRRGGGRSAAGLTRGATGMGSSRGWSYAIAGAGWVAGGRVRFTVAGSDASAEAFDATRVQASELRPEYTQE